MANVNNTTLPSTKIRLKNIRPAFNPIIFGFNSESIGLGINPYAEIAFSSALGSGTDFSAVEGDYIDFNGVRFFFRDNPSFGELGTGWTRPEAVDNFLRILRFHPTLKNNYVFNKINVSVGYDKILAVSTIKSVLFEVTLSATATNMYLFATTGGSSGYRGGDTPNWGVFVECIALNTSFNRNLMDPDGYQQSFPYDSIFLVKDWQGVIEQNVDDTEKLINFDVASFLKNYVSIKDPFNIVGFNFNVDALIRYILVYGEKYSDTLTSEILYNQIISIEEGSFPYYAHYSMLSKEISPYSHLPVSDVVFLENDLDAAFLHYWDRGTPYSTSINLLEFLTFQPQEFKIAFEQKVFLSFIYDWHIFIEEDDPTVKQNTKLFLNYDLYFVDGTSVLSTNLTSSITTISKFGHYCVECGLDLIDTDAIEASQGSLIESIIWRVKEFKASDVIANARTISEDKKFLVDQETREFQENNKLGELIFLNSLGGWDSLFSNTEITVSVEASNVLHDVTNYYPNQISTTETTEGSYNTIDKDVLNVEINKTIDIVLDYQRADIHRYLLELLKSPRIFFNENRVSIISTNYQNVYNESMQSFSIKLQYLLDENISK